MEVAHFAKIWLETGESCGLDRTHYVAEIARLAKASKRGGESDAQAWTRVATESDQGRLLFKAAVMGPAPKQAPQDFPLPSKPLAAGPASEELNELARDMARRKNISFEQAHTALQTDPERKELVARVRREERDATRMVHDTRWPIRDAEERFARDWRLGSNPASGRM
jgi:hypothetical protein